MKKIDIHCHTSSRIISDCISPDASVGHIACLMNEYDVEKTVLLATYFPHKGTGVSNFHLNNWIRHADQFFMFGSLDFEHYFYQGLNEIEELAYEKLIRGIKIYTCYQDVDIKSDKFDKVMQLALLHNLPVMFHAGVSYAAYRKYKKKTISQLYTARELAYVAEKYTDLDFIFSHLSKPNFDDMVKTAIIYPNVYSDVSGLIDSKYNRDEIPNCIEQVNKFVNECGPEKLLFGTDFPVQSHEDSIKFVEEGMEGFSDEDKQKVYYDNAANLLKLEG